MRLEETRRFTYKKLETVAEDTAQGTGYHASGTVGQRACKKCIQQSMPFYRTGRSCNAENRREVSERKES